MKIIFGVIDTDKAGRVAEFCDVDPESAKLELRILTKGGTRCEQYLEPESLVCFCLCASRADRFRNERDGAHREEELRDSAQPPELRGAARGQVEVALHRGDVSVRASVLRLLHPGGEGGGGLRGSRAAPLPRRWSRRWTSTASTAR